MWGKQGKGVPVATLLTGNMVKGQLEKNPNKVPD